MLNKYTLVTVAAIIAAFAGSRQGLLSTKLACHKRSFLRGVVDGTAATRKALGAEERQVEPEAAHERELSHVIIGGSDNTLA